MKIESFKPRSRIDVPDAEGAVTATMFEEYGRVELFTYPGGRHGGPFTTMATHIKDREYHAKFPRCYHRRWFGRLASRFAWECWQKAKGGEG